MLGKVVLEMASFLRYVADLDFDWANVRLKLLQ